MLTACWATDKFHSSEEIQTTGFENGEGANGHGLVVELLTGTDSFAFVSPVLIIIARVLRVDVRESAIMWDLEGFRAELAI